MQGFTDETQAHFVIVSEEQKLFCKVSDQNNEKNRYLPSKELDLDYKNSKNHVHQCSFINLENTKSYRLEIYNENNLIVNTRYFKTLNFENKKFRVAIVSCISDIVHIPLLWDNLKDQNPDYIFMIGDNVYGDLFHDYIEITESHLWERYARSWKVFKIFQQTHLKPVLAIWDDHDFGKNNSDSSFENKEFSLFLFRTFFNQEYDTLNLEQGPGVSFSFKVAKNVFIFLDDRFFRDSNENKRGSYFSENQVHWIKDQFKKNADDTFWLISGNQWFGTKGQDESFEINHPETLYLFFRSIELDKFNVHLISGDSHFSEIKKILVGDKNVYEITSSAMHALPVGKMEPDSRRLSGSNFPNFVMAEFNSKENLNHTFSSYTLFNYELFRHTIPLKN